MEVVYFLIEIMNKLSVEFVGKICFLSLSFAFAYSIYKKLFRHETNTKTLPPGPKGLTTLKTLLNGMWKENLHQAAEKWAKDYGEVVLCRTIIGNICFLNSARATREAFKGKESEAVTNERPRTFIGWYLFYNYKNVATGGPTLPYWTLQRKMFHSALKFYGDGIDHFESTVQVELDRLKERLGSNNKILLSKATSPNQHIQQLADGSKEVDMKEILVSSLVCVLSVLMTGECPTPDDPIVGILRDSVHWFVKLFNPAVDQTLTLFPFLRFVPGSKYKLVCEEVIKDREKLLKELFQMRKTTRTPGFPRGIIDYLEDEQAKEENSWITEEHIFGLIIDIVAAATITSLNTLLSTVFLLVHHPNVMKKIQHEIDDKIGQRQPQLQDRKSLHYTEAVILETLRYTSIAPLGIPHENTEEFYIDGFCIPKNTLIFSNTWFFHRDPAMWNNGDEFRPERFLDDNGNLLPSSHPLLQSLLPFGIGKRACPGENFARSRIFLYVTNLLQKFDIHPPVKHELPPFTRQCWQNGLVLQVRKYHVIMKQRTGVV